MNNWDSHVTPEEIADTVGHYNEQVGPSRHVSATAAVYLVEQAFNYYNYLDGEERADAVRYDLQSFCEYATTAFNEGSDLEFSDRYSTLLASGHPYSPNSNRELLSDWIAGAPELTTAGRDAIVASLSPNAAPELINHANIRLTLMAQKGELSAATMTLLEQALRS